MSREHKSRLFRRLSSKARLRVELLETRNLLSGASFALTPLVALPGTNLLPDTSDTIGQSGHVRLNSEVEPQIAVDPTDPTHQHVVAVWQQDRWSNGGSRALVEGDSVDGGNTWTRQVIPGLSLASGGVYARASDPWVSFAPNGDLYVTSLSTTLAGPFPSRSAILVTKLAHGSSAWQTPVTLIDDTSPFPKDQLNDKEAVTADPTDPTGQTAYVIWDRIQLPSDNADTSAFHSLGFREDIFFSRTTDGGKTWEPTRNLTNFLANQSAFGNQIVVEPDGTLVDAFTLANGSGNQPPQADQNLVGVIRSTDHGVTWSAPTAGPAEEVIPVTDPNNGATVRSGEPIIDVAADPKNGNLYTVWADGRFSNFAHDDIAFSMSTDGGLTWSNPIKVNQTPTNIPAGNQQAFTPSVAVAANGTVAITYYDFRNPDGITSGLPADYWITHADANFTNPSSWQSENRLTDASFNMENAPVANGLFLGDYQGLAAGGNGLNSFYALFAQAGSGSADPSNMFFRDPPPAATQVKQLPASVPSSNLVAAFGVIQVMDTPVMRNSIGMAQKSEPALLPGSSKAPASTNEAPAPTSFGQTKARHDLFSNSGSAPLQDPFADDGTALSIL
jgi:hypothetical protein